MSMMSERLSLPEGIEIPAELERAWVWMEQQGWGSEVGQGYYLTPYAGDAQLGIVYADRVTLEGWFPAGQVDDRLVPIAETAGDGSLAALWLREDGALWFVGLGSEGDAYVLATSAVDFLRLTAVGYEELTPMYLGDAPDEEESVEAHAQFRAWVEETFAVDVPPEWPTVDREDEFHQWVGAQLGWESTPEPEAPSGMATGAVSGDVVAILDALDVTDGAERMAALLGLPDASNKSLRAAGIELEKRRGRVETIWVSLVAEGKKAAYPRPERLIDGLAPEADAEQVIAVLGEPELQGPWGVRYVIGGRFLHFEIEEGVGIAMLTAMVDAP